MPDEIPGEKLEWTTENFQTLLAELYRDVVTDRALHDQLLADPYEVLNSRIHVPDEFKGKVFAQDRTAKILVLNVPSFGQRTEVVEGTTSSSSVPDYLLCTTETEW